MGALVQHEVRARIPALIVQFVIALACVLAIFYARLQFRITDVFFGAEDLGNLQWVMAPVLLVLVWDTFTAPKTRNVCLVPLFLAAMMRAVGLYRANTLDLELHR